VSADTPDLYTAASKLLALCEEGYRLTGDAEGLARCAETRAKFPEVRRVETEIRMPNLDDLRREGL
jgi:hypothetical protein